VPALSLTVTVAECAIARPGVKVTLIVQLPPTARPVPPIGQLFVCANRPGLVPPSEIREITTGAAPVFVTVTTCAALVVLIDCAPKGIIAGDTFTIGATVVPVKATEPETAGAATRTVSEAVRVAVLFGVNTTLTVQFAPAASPAPRIGQLVVCPKRPGFAPPETDAVDDQCSRAEVSDQHRLRGAHHVDRRTGNVRLAGLSPSTGPLGVMVNAGVLLVIE